MRGASVLTPLALLFTVSMMAALFQSNLMGSHASVIRSLDLLLQSSMSVSAAGESERHYGACGDICTIAGACRHVVLTGGLHGGQKVMQQVLIEAESCR